MGYFLRRSFLLAPLRSWSVFFKKRDLSPLDSCHADLAGAARSIFWKLVRDTGLIPKVGKLLSYLPLTVSVVIRED